MLDIAPGFAARKANDIIPERIANYFLPVVDGACGQSPFVEATWPCVESMCHPRYIPVHAGDWQAALGPLSEREEVEP